MAHQLQSCLWIREPLNIPKLIMFVIHHFQELESSLKIQDPDNTCMGKQITYNYHFHWKYYTSFTILVPILGFSSFPLLVYQGVLKI